MRAGPELEVGKRLARLCDLRLWRPKKLRHTLGARNSLGPLGLACPKGRPFCDRYC